MSETDTNPAVDFRSRLLADYRLDGARFDEAVAAGGTIRPHYEEFLRELDSQPTRELRRRWETGRRFIHEQGITYHIYGDPRGLERAWRLDPIPLILGAAEWQGIEQALIQRATLLNRILVDCYGPQRLIHEGRLPPALVFAQPDFLRACHGIRPAHDTFLALYAADLSRAPDGSWWVVSDRTQIPTGAGYALANRLVTTRMLPDSFRHSRVHRLALFFREIQASLAHLAAGRTDNPRVVMLTPGSYNETYFEQAYLARYLGYTLVEGQDLTVRNGHVYLKTLSGLEPVDVILRRVDDDFCDPLELRNDSMLGVPGLLDAWRAGNVAVANAIGSGLLQNPAFLAFLPGLCRHILGEELKLPSVATWWCGQAEAEKYVHEHLDEVIVRSAFRGRTPGATEWPRSPEEREALQRHIAFQPHLFVGQEPIVPSTAPSWQGDGLAGRPVGMRVYLVANPQGGYTVMPGGLARIAPDDSGNFLSLQRGGAAKDVWVLSNEPVAHASLLATSGHSIELRRVGNNLPSRMADNYYWLGRYAERADATARLLRSALMRFSPESAGGASPAVGPILKSLMQQGQIRGDPSADTHPDADELEREFREAFFSADRRGSLRHTADEMVRLAIQVRDRSSHDFWRAVSRFNDRLTRPPSFANLFSGEAVTFLNQLILNLASFHGLANETMTRAQGWRFLDMGHRLERAICLCTFLGYTLQSPEGDDVSVLESVLEVADSSITYRSRYNLLPHVAAVYDLVLLDDANPRSLLFQLNQLTAHFEHLPREKSSALPTPAQRLLLDALNRLQLADPTELERCRRDWSNTALASVIQHVTRVGPMISDALAASYFAHSTYSVAGPAANTLG